MVQPNFDWVIDWYTFCQDSIGPHSHREMFRKVILWEAVVETVTIHLLCLFLSTEQFSKVWHSRHHFQRVLKNVAHCSEWSSTSWSNKVKSFWTLVFFCFFFFASFFLFLLWQVRRFSNLPWADVCLYLQIKKSDKARVTFFKADHWNQVFQT